MIQINLSKLNCCHGNGNKQKNNKSEKSIFNAKLKEKSHNDTKKPSLLKKMVKSVHSMLKIHKDKQKESTLKRQSINEDVLDLKLDLNVDHPITYNNELYEWKKTVLTALNETQQGYSQTANLQRGNHDQCAMNGNNEFTYPQPSIPDIYSSPNITYNDMSTQSSQATSPISNYYSSFSSNNTFSDISSYSTSHYDKLKYNNNNIGINHVKSLSKDMGYYMTPYLPYASNPILPNIMKRREVIDDHVLFSKKELDTFIQSVSNTEAHKNDTQHRSLLTNQLKYEHKHDPIKEKLEQAAARRNQIRNNRLREQNDMLLFETLHLLNDQNNLHKFFNSNNDKMSYKNRYEDNDSSSFMNNHHDISIW
ncbi:hypothetical protein BDB01DRAFT_894077 [Pilobolus umbonatus]|nr:hypothetical protein BDB01DRAFT_894077 [Pilobolus umbonatus]